MNSEPFNPNSPAPEFRLPSQSLLAHAPAARRLQEVTQSIESFFQTQLKRLEQALASCQRNAKEGETVKRILADIELQKQKWEFERQSEIERLNEASERLSRGWDELENLRRRALTEVSLPTNTGRTPPPATNLAGTAASGSAASPIADNCTPVAASDCTLAELTHLRDSMKNHAKRKRR